MTSTIEHTGSTTPQQDCHEEILAVKTGIVTPTMAKIKLPMCVCVCVIFHSHNTKMGNNYNNM